MPLGLTGYGFREARGLAFRRSLANRAALMVLLAAVFPGVANARSYALLVGVGQQPAVDMLTHRPLKGTGNDIKNMRQMLLREYRFQEQDIRMLLDGAATLPRVRKEFVELAAESTKDDVVVFHYAGHGTAIPDDNGDELQDGIDEALCLYGCGADMTGALRDDELGRLLDELPASEVVVVLDCCHSGTATRSVDGLPRVGQIRFVPARLEDAAWNRNPAGRTRATNRSTADELGSAGRDGQKRIVFSACAARQQACEINPITVLYAVWSGSLTYFLVEGLRGPADSNGDGQVSYLEAQSHVVRRIDSLCDLAQENEQLRQNPVLEATPAEVADAPVFRLTDKTPAYAALTAGSGANKITLDLGAIHGIKPSQRLGVFPMVNGTPRLAQPMAEIVVETTIGRNGRAVDKIKEFQEKETPLRRAYLCFRSTAPLPGRDSLLNVFRDSFDTHPHRLNLRLFEGSDANNETVLEYLKSLERGEAALKPEDTLSVYYSGPGANLAPEQGQYLPTVLPGFTVKWILRAAR